MRGDRGSPVILVVDDEAPIRLLYRVNLEAEGLRVVEAADGPTGLAAAQTENPDLIVLDVMMPALDGWRVAEELRAGPATRHIPFIFATPRKKYRDQLRGLELGAVEYLILPFNPLELAPVIRDLLARGARGDLERRRQENIARVKALLERDPTGPPD